MRDIWYLVLPLIISALITPVVKQIGTGWTLSRR